MKYLILRYFFLFTLMTGVAKPSFGQMPDFSKVPLLREGDSLNITHLINHGVKISKPAVICWFPTDSLSQKQMNDITEMIHRGIIAAEKFIHFPQPWQLHQPGKPFTFYFRTDRFISHASGHDFVSIPFWRIKDGKAPWLHECLHEMLYIKTESWYSKTVTEKEWSEKMPLWLFEGLPDCISLKVSALENLSWFDVFSDSYKPNIDSLFIQEIKSGNGSYILSFIGKEGVMPELFSDERIHYAPAFYHGSHSFVKYLVDHYDLKFLLAGISSFRKEHETIAKLTGKPVEELKKNWLDALKISK